MATTKTAAKKAAKKPAVKAVPRKLHHNPYTERAVARGQLDFRRERKNGTAACYCYDLEDLNGKDTACYIPEGNDIDKAKAYAGYWMRRKGLDNAVLMVRHAETMRLKKVVPLSLDADGEVICGEREQQQE